MKKSLLTSLALISAGIFALSGCGKEEPQPDPKPEPIAVEYIAVSTDATSFITNTEAKFNAAVYPSNASNKEVTWSVSNPDIATISEVGKFVATTTGELDVIATAKDGSNVKGSYHVVVECNPSDELKVLVQPKTVHINYPDAFSFDFEVNLPNKVKSYEWEAGTYNIRGEATGFKPMGGEATKSKKLYVPGTTRETGKIPFRCHMIDVNDKDLYTDVCEYYIDNKSEFIPVAYLCDYPIVAGKSLDLSTTPYGTGLISANEDATHFTFQDVIFNNTHLETTHNGVGFHFTSENSTIEEYTLEFKGTNIFTNTYWEDDYNQGASAFLLSFLGNNNCTKNVNFTGDGTLSIYGGSFAIKAFCKVTVDIDLSIYGQAKRFHKGIVSYGFELAENKVLNAITGGHIVFTENNIDSDLFRQTDVILNKGSKIIGSIYPGSVVNGSTSVSALAAQNDVVINEAQVDINFVCDSTFFLTNYHSINPFTGINSNGGEIYLTKSNISIKATTINDEIDQELPIDTSVSAVFGISGKIIEAVESNINIDLKSPRFMNIFGIYSADMTFTGCDIQIDVKGLKYCSGIVAPFNTATPGFIYLEYCNANINVYSNSVEEEMDVDTDAGIRGKEIHLAPTGDGKIIVNTNGAPALVCTYKLGDEEVDPVPNQEDVENPGEVIRYQPEYLHPDEAGVLSTWVEYEYNRNSYPITVLEDGKYVRKYVAYETMYEIFEGSFLKYFVTHIEISTF